MLLSGLLVLAATGCTRRGTVVARSGAHRLTAADETTGVTAVMTTGVWTGAPSDLAEQWTVMHLLVANMGDQPVLLAPGDFELRDLRGFSYALIDPGATFFRAADELRPVGTYGREYRRDYDPGGPVDFIPFDAGGDVGHQALPWGVLQPGTQMRGFVYFEDMELTANGGAMIWHATTPDHTPLVDLKFDLLVAR